jgi:hypothetical protein
MFDRWPLYLWFDILSGDAKPDDWDAIVFGPYLISSANTASV